MSTPNLPALATRKFSVNTASGSMPHALAAADTAFLATVDDAGETGITAWLTTLDGTGKYLLATPPASSPIYQKIVLIFAGEPAATVNAGAMNLDGNGNGIMFFGMWCANAGATVTMADYSNWTAAAPFTGTGTFSGWFRWFTPTAATRVVLWRTLEYFAMIADQAGRFLVYGGAGGTRMDTANGESGLGGRSFDYGTSGGALVANFSVVAAAAGGMLVSSATTNTCHWMYRRPTGLTWRHMQPYGSGSTRRGPMGAVDGQLMDDLGNCQPQPIPLYDGSAGLGISSTVACVHRFFHYGPYQYSDVAIRNVGNARIFLTLGNNVAANCDCLALPV